MAAFPHPDWTGDTRDGNDLVILKLNKKTCLTPIKNFGKAEVSRGDVLQFFSYGRSGETSAFSNTLQTGPFSFIPQSACQKRFDLDLRDNEMCFNGDGGVVGVCTGIPPAPPEKNILKGMMVGRYCCRQWDCLDSMKTSLPLPLNPPGDVWTEGPPSSWTSASSEIGSRTHVAPFA